MLPKRWMIAIVTIAWIVVAGVLISLDTIVDEIHRYLYNTQKYSAETVSERLAGRLNMTLRPTSNPVSGPVASQFQDYQSASLKDPIPQFPVPYDQYCFLLRVGKSVRGYHYDSPYLPEGELPKQLIEKVVETPPYIDIKLSERYTISAIPIKRTDTSYFHVMIVDYDRMESVLTQLVQPTMRYSEFFGHVFPSLDKPSPNTAGWLYVSFTRFGKPVYESRKVDLALFDTVYAKINEQGLNLTIMAEKSFPHQRPERIEERLKKFKQAELKYFLLYTLGLVMLLRGGSIVVTVKSWLHSRRK